MPSAAESVYPNGPSTQLGNKSDPLKVLNSFEGGNHEAAFALGNREHREAYVELYGYEKTIDLIDGFMANKKKNGGKPWTPAFYEGLEDYKAELLSRQGS